MKKLLAFALVAASFVACNDAATDSSTTTDTSTVITPVASDTQVVVKETTVTTDTLNVADTTKK